MVKLTVIAQDKQIGVDGSFLSVEHTYPNDLWAIQWDGSEGFAELTNGTVRPLSEEEAQEYVDLFNAEFDRLYVENKNSCLNEVAEDAARMERNALLEETDWQGASDVVMTTAQAEYRQALRDLPQSNGWNPSWRWVDTDTDKLSHYAELVGVDWPINPNETV